MALAPYAEGRGGRAPFGGGPGFSNIPPHHPQQPHQQPGARPAYLQHGHANGGGAAPGTSNSSQGTGNANTVQSNFKRLDLVGRGAYGAVYRGVHIASGKAVALKVVNLDTPDDDVSDIQREVALLSQLRETTTKNVIKYWGCWLLGAELCIVMDFAEGGSVRTLMNAGPIAEKYAAVIVRESLVALSYLHKSGIIHRDIKAANILLTNAGDVLLCDFGVAAAFVSSSVHSRRTTFVGTPYWMAPEVITQGKSYDQSADIWSLGITVYEMCTGNPPLADQEQMRAIMLIPKNKPARLPAEGPFSQLMREFVALCLNEEPRERPNADELGKTKWIKNNAKVPNSTLRDLISAYTSWMKTGGMRMSLLGAEASDLNDAANRESFAFDGYETNEGWEFNNTFEDFAATNDQATPLAPPRDHPLLRLFDESDGDEQNGPMALRGPAGNTTQAPVQYKGTEVRPAPAPPGPVPSRPPASATTASPPSSSAQLTEPVMSAPVCAPATGAAAAAASAQGRAFTGTGATPFRFGGGGGTTPIPSSPPPEPTSVETIQPIGQEPPVATAQEKPLRSWDTAGKDEHRKSFGSERRSIGTEPHRRQGSMMSNRSNSVTAEGSSGNVFVRHRPTPSSSTSIYSHSPGASDASGTLSTANERRLGMVDGFGFGQAKHLGHFPSSMHSFSEMDDTARSINHGPSSTRAGAGAGTVPFFDAQVMSTSPASDLNNRSGAQSSVATLASSASAMPPPPHPGLSGRPVGIGMRSRSGSRSRPWQSGSEGEAYLGEIVHPPLPNRSALAKHLGLSPSASNNISGSALADGNAKIHATSSHQIQNGTNETSGALGSPAALHQRRQHGGSDPTQMLTRRHSREVDAKTSLRGPAGAGAESSAHRMSPRIKEASLDGAGTTRAEATVAQVTAAASHGAPPLHTLDLSQLVHKDDVYLELDRTIESLGRWLDVVGSGLARVVGSS